MKCDTGRPARGMTDAAGGASAGLRVILRLRKQEPELAIVNASPEVYEIFEMTGFTEMMPVSRAYRRVSVDGCEVIGQGANGKVYRLDPETIIKVYLNPNSLPDIHRERELARKAFVLGIPTAIPYDVVKVGDGYGSVFELLNAKSFGSLIAEHPEEMDKYVKMYVNLLLEFPMTAVNLTCLQSELVLASAQLGMLDGERLRSAKPQKTGPL